MDASSLTRPGDRPSGRGLVLLVELSPSVPNLGQFIVMPRQGLLSIASILQRETDYRVKLLYEPYLGGIDVDAVAADRPRFVLLNGLTTTADDNHRFATALRERLGSAIPIITGGEHAAMYPEDARRYADYIITHEGDAAVLQLLAALEEPDARRRDLALGQVSGLHFRDARGAWQHNAAAARVESIDYRYDLTIVTGAQDAGRRFGTAYMPVQTSRGCKYQCSFCTWIRLFGAPGYFLRPIADVVHDLRHAVDYAGVYRFIVSDNLFGGDIAYTGELLRSVLSEFAGHPTPPQLTVLCRADQFIDSPRAMPDELIGLMARAGVKCVSLGLESFSEQSLRQMSKRSGIDLYTEAAARLRRHGIELLATFVAGFDGDTEQDVIGIADHGERLGLFTIQVYARNLTPGTRDASSAADRYLPGNLTRYRNGHSVNFLPAQMLPSVLQRAIFDASFRFHRAAPRRERTLRALEYIWASLQPHLRGLERIEGELLIPLGLYQGTGGRWRLDQAALRDLTTDTARYRALSERTAALFEAEGMAG